MTLSNQLSVTLMPRDYDLLVITTSNLCSKYYPLTAMLCYVMQAVLCFNCLGDKCLLHAI